MTYDEPFHNTISAGSQIFLTIACVTYVTDTKLKMHDILFCYAHILLSREILCCKKSMRLLVLQVITFLKTMSICYIEY